MSNVEESRPSSEILMWMFVHCKVVDMVMTGQREEREDDERE